MKYILFVLLLLSGCGYQSRNNELIGQVKSVSHETPIICSEYDYADISLGVMRNGVGSMSSEDTFVHVKDKSSLTKLKLAAETGTLVKVKFDQKRFSLCLPLRVILAVEVIK